jgi:SpoVK/Ycf46/Vps4 family AAA+-type ATPase
MPTGDLLRKLLVAHATNDDGLFREAAHGLINEERAKHHRLLADDLERILERSNGSPISRRGVVRSLLPEVPRDRERGLPLVGVTAPETTWSQLVVPEAEERLLRDIVDQHKREDHLRTAGLRPVRRVLFVGPPGCGKSLTARVLASALEYPLVTVQIAGLVSSYLGETAANLSRVFEFLRAGRYVVLFDEFDAIARSRDDPTEHGEIKRVVNALLQSLDGDDSRNLLIAATNHESVLDNAVWRRFELFLAFSYPAEDARRDILRVFLRGFEMDERILASVASRSDGMSGGDLEVLAVGAARRAVLSLRGRLLKDDFALGFEQWAIKRQLTGTNLGTQPMGQTPI